MLSLHIDALYIRKQQGPSLKAPFWTHERAEHHKRRARSMMYICGRQSLLCACAATLRGAVQAMLVQRSGVGRLRDSAHMCRTSWSCPCVSPTTRTVAPSSTGLTCSTCSTSPTTAAVMCQAHHTGVHAEMLHHASSARPVYLCKPWLLQAQSGDNTVTGAAGAHIEDCGLVSQKQTHGLQELHSSVCRQDFSYCIDSLP